MQSLRYSIKLILAYIRRFKGILIISIIFGSLLFYALTSLIPNISDFNTEKIAVTGRYHSEELPDFIKEMISEGLTKIDTDGQAIPGLASSWESSDSGRVWNFKIREGVFWQDGEELDSDHVNYNFSDVEIIKNNDRSVTFKLKDPFSPFPTAVSTPIFKSGLLGTDEWIVKNIRLNGGYVQELLLTNSQKQNKLFRFYPTTDRTKTAFKLGKVDKIMELDQAEPFDTWENLNIEKSANTSQVAILFFNVKDEILSDKTLRQGLAYAIKKDRFSERAISPISPDSWAFNPQVKTYEFDPTRAKEIIDDMPSEMKEGLTLSLSTTSTLLKTAEGIASDWKEAGISTDIQVVSVIPTEFQAFLTILDIPDDPDQYSLWHTTQTATNISNFSNLRIDKLLEDGRSIIDFDERRTIYLDFQRFLLEDLPAIFLYHPSYYTVSRK